MILDGNSDGTDHCLSGCFLRSMCDRLYLSGAGVFMCDVGGVRATLNVQLTLKWTDEIMPSTKR